MIICPKASIDISYRFIYKKAATYTFGLYIKTRKAGYVRYVINSIDMIRYLCSKPKTLLVYIPRQRFVWRTSITGGAKRNTSGLSDLLPKLFRLR